MSKQSGQCARAHNVNPDCQDGVVGIDSVGWITLIDSSKNVSHLVALLHRGLSVLSVCFDSETAK